MLVFALSGVTSLQAATDFLLAQAQIDSNAPPATDKDNESDKPGKFGNFLPLPIVITEPAIGQGLGATLIYFHNEEDERKARVSTPDELSRTGERSKPPPTATGIFGFYTNNDTAAVGIGHSNSFVDDHFRLRVAAAKARINSTFYLGDEPIGFRLEGNMLFADMKFRLGDSDTFLGLSSSYIDAGNKFGDGSDGIDGLLDFDFVDVGLAASLTYDTRDNTILPTNGFLVELTGWQHDESIGSDFNYSLASFKGLWFTPLGKKYVLGARIVSSAVDGNPPFFAFPYVRLRGIPALRYQGEVASAIEFEARRQVAERWTASLFAGAGSVRVGAEQVETEDEIRTIGIGTRFLAFREQDAWVGVDIARGPEDLTAYIQVGSSW